MKAIILAAGRGSRMEKLTDQKPKCLVEINDESLLDRQLTALRAAGITDIAIVTGYQHHLLDNKALTTFYNSRWQETNMVSSLLCAEQWLQNESFIVSYSDIFYTDHAVKLLLSEQADIGISYDPNWLSLWQKRFHDPLIDAETFAFDSDGRLNEIGRKADSLDEIQGQYMGLLIFSPKGWKAFKNVFNELANDTKDKIHMTGMLQKIIDSGCMPVQTVEYQGEWGEVDSESDLKVYEFREKNK